MSTSINVGKATIAEFLRTGISKQFIIPEFQRTYDWKEEQIRTLFEDIWHFTVEEGGPDQENATYFLGCIVSYEDSVEETDSDGKTKRPVQMIIDGQQRLTSFFLLLRAIYTKLCQSSNQSDLIVSNYKRQIESSIWKLDKYTAEVIFDHPLLVSKAISEKKNEVLHDILCKGVAEADDNNYSKNYKLFIKMYEEHSQDDPLLIYNFLYALLHQTIILPITADSQDTALTIFSTLNDRGLPLTDADIFKAKIYKHLEGESAKDKFIEAWKALNDKAADAGETLVNLFTYYMFYLRAKDGDSNNSTIGLRSYYSKENRLYEFGLLDKLEQILNLTLVFNQHKSIDKEPWSENTAIQMVLDVLRLYPNEWWKYPVIIYYLVHKNESAFENNFLIFLRKLCLELIIRYIEYSTIYGIKNSVLKLDIGILSSQTPEISFAREKRIPDISADIIVPNNQKVLRMLLAVLAYQHPGQKDLLPDNWEIEHILPRKYQNNYFTDIPDAKVKEKLEHIGNKVAAEKKTNISAGNGYFAKKQAKYKEFSKVAAVLDLASRESADWTLEDIEKRDQEAADLLIKTFTEWDEKYRQARS